MAMVMAVVAMMVAAVEEEEEEGGYFPKISRRKPHGAVRAKFVARDLLLHM